MATGNWEKAKRIFGDAINVAPDERPRFLDRVCDGDAAVRREVESLLSSFDRAEVFLEKPIVGEMAAEAAPIKKSLFAKGQGLGHYKIIQPIGAGGMGEVYLAKDKKLDRKVAIKVLNEKFSQHESNLNRFTQEAKAASALNHPNILVIHEIGEAGETHYIVSEYIEGKTLRERLKESPMNLLEVMDIAVQTASALVAAHEAHLVHRDIKPENVMIRPDGLVKILDFGLAKLVEQKPIGFEETTVKQNETAKGVILGTVCYMSPEQARGEKIDDRTDIFSFGIVMYEMLAGRTPFAGDSMSETLANLINAEPQPLLRYAANVPDELQRIVFKMLRKSKDERYQTMKGLLADLKNLRENLAFDERLEKSHPPDAENATQILQATTGDLHKPNAETQHSFLLAIKRHKSATLAALAIFVIALTIVGYFAFFAPQSPITSVAVLPFVNGSNDAGLDYLSDGLSESVIDRLSQLPQLKVIARSSSFKYRGENIDIQDAANKLGVQAIVTGRIVQRGDNLSIRVEMVDARENRQVWSEQYNRKATDASAVQQEVAQTVSEQLHLKLSGTQEQKLAKRETVNPQAYELVLKGRFLHIKGGIDNIKKASEYYQQAIAIDPNYALAYVHLAGSYMGLIGHSILDPKEFKPKAKAAVQKALELDPNLPEAYLRMGYLYQSDWNWAAAETEFKRAIELNPNSVGARNSYAGYLSIIGRHDEAIAEARRTKELDPLTLGTHISVGYTLFQARRYDEAIAEFKKILEIDKNNVGANYWLKYAYLYKGMYREAIDSFQEAIRLGGDNPSDQIYLGAAYAKAGEREKAQAILKQLETRKEYVSPGELPVLYVALGEREKAFASFEKAYAARDLQLQFLKVDPSFDPLRDDPRFQDLLRRVGFSD